MSSRSLGSVLLLALALRVPWIADPPLNHHHIRQCDTLSIVRALNEEGGDHLRPRVHWGGIDGAVVEAEMPLYAAVVSALVPKGITLGPGLWVAARGTSILAFLLGAAALVRMAGPLGIHPAASLLGWALSPLALIATTSVQPDSLAVAFLLWAAEAALRRRSVLIVGLWLGLVGLCKANVLVFAPAVIGAMVAMGTTARERRTLVLRCAGAALLGALIALPWFMHARLLATEGLSFGIWGRTADKWSFGGAGLDVASVRSMAAWTVLRALGPLGCIAALGALMTVLLRPAATGLTETPPHPPSPPLLGLTLGALVGWALLVLTLAPAFAVHDYYALGGAALLGPWIGDRIVRLAARWGWVRVGAAVLLIALPWTATALAEGHKLDTSIPILAAEVRRHSPTDRPIWLRTRFPTTVLFFADRRGWATWPGTPAPGDLPDNAVLIDAGWEESPAAPGAPAP